MKNHFHRVLALLVALLVLCAPLSAMAEDYQSATFILSNPTIAMGDNSLTVEAALRLDIGGDIDAGKIVATLAALAQDQQALKAGMEIDMSSMQLTAGIEGMTDGVSLPLDELIEAAQAQLSSLLPGDTMEKAQKAAMALQELMTAAQTSEAAAAVQQTVMAWFAAHFPEDGNKGETTIEVQGATLTVNQYDFSLTLADCLDLAKAVWEIAKNDPAIAPALQNWMDAWCDLGGVDHIDIATYDYGAALEQLSEADVTFAGSLYNSAEGAMILDLIVSVAEDDETESLPMRFAVLPSEEVVLAFFNATVDEGEDAVEISIAATVPADGTPAFDYAVNVSGANMNMTFTFTVNAADGLTVNLYGEMSTAFTYDDQEYKSLQAFGVNYTGAEQASDDGTAYAGVITLYNNTDGQEVTISADTLLSLNNANTAVIDMPHNLIDVTKADEETMESLMGEVMAALQNGLAILMSAPGASALMGGLTGAAA